MGYASQHFKEVLKVSGALAAAGACANLLCHLNDADKAVTVIKPLVFAVMAGGIMMVSTVLFMGMAAVAIAAHNAATGRKTPELFTEKNATFTTCMIRGSGALAGIVLMSVARGA